MASSSGSKTPPSSSQPPAAAASSAARDCESCRTAPGIPFCRVEWSFLCSGCAAVVHGHNWVVPVNPNSSTPGPIPPNYPYYPYPFPYPNPSSAAHLSSDEDDLSPAHPGRGRIQVPGTAASYRRLESVMRYREKRKSRRFVKTVRYENRRAYAELRPRVDGKFASRKAEGGGEEAGPPDEMGDEHGVVVGENVGLNRVLGLKPDGSELGGLAAGGEELGRPDFMEDVRFQ